MSEHLQFVQGNIACARAALYAGLDFFAGYPIAPSSEIAEFMARELPKKGGKLLQMEDEIASLCAIIGASLTGHQVMTATSGPCFSLIQTVEKKIGNPIVLNLCMLGAVVRLTGLVAAQSVTKVIRERVPKDFFEINEAAFAIG